MATAVQAARNKKIRERQRRDGVMIKENVLEIFEKYDEDGSGDIDKSELAAALIDLGLDVPQAKVNVILNQYCKKGAESLDIDTFDMLVSDLMAHRNKGPTHRKSEKAKPPPPPEPFLAYSWRGKNKPLPYQAQVRAVYTHPVCVTIVACFIIGNFVVNILEKE